MQICVPLRHWLYPGDVAWTEEGHRFAWRMKLRSKHDAGISFVVTDETGRSEHFVDPLEHLILGQLEEMIGRPDMILQLCHHLARIYAARGVERPRCFVRAAVSLNGRPPALLIDPGVDLAAEPRTLGHAHWLTVQREPLAARSPILRENPGRR